MDIIWTQGSTHFKLPVYCIQSDGGAVDLSTVTSVVAQLRVDLPGSSYFQCAGTYSVQDPVNGLLYYQFAAADVAIAGRFRLQIKLVYADGPGFSLEYGFEIMPSS